MLSVYKRFGDLYIYSIFLMCSVQKNSHSKEKSFQSKLTVSKKYFHADTRQKIREEFYEFSPEISLLIVIIHQKTLGMSWSSYSWHVRCSIRERSRYVYWAALGNVDTAAVVISERPSDVDGHRHVSGK